MSESSIKPPTSTWFISRYIWLGWFAALVIATVILHHVSYDEKSKTRSGDIFCPIFPVWGLSIFFWVRWLLARMRTSGFMKLAGTHGMEFKGSIRKQDLELYPTFYLFQTTQFSEGKNYTAGKMDGVEMVLMDYGYATFRQLGQYTDSSTHRQTVLILPNAAPELPNFSLIAHRSRIEKVRHNSPLDDVPELAIGRDNEAFTSLFKVAGDDGAAIARVLTPAATSLLTEHEGWNIEVRHGTPLFYIMEHRVGPRDIPAWIAQAQQLLRILQGSDQAGSTGSSEGT